jgi:hypothetical protein
MKVPHETIEGYYTVVELDDEEDLCSKCISVARSMNLCDHSYNCNNEDLAELGIDLPELNHDHYEN